MRRFIWLTIPISFACRSDPKGVIDSNTEAEVVLDEDGDGFLSNEDCDDEDSSTNPSAVEVCDGIDNNCDGNIDEDVRSTYFADDDGDGFGAEASSIEACDTPNGYVANANDCDDSSAESHPGAIEVCDGIDNNCDGDIDENIGELYYQDGDGDGFGSEDVTFLCTIEEGYSTESGDCDDNNNSVFPDAIEACDGVDNNCDGVVDEEVGNLFYADVDEDGFGDPGQIEYFCTRPSGYVENDWDCNDVDSLVYPGAMESCDFIDNNCDGQVDEDGAQGSLIWYIDADEDGYGDATNVLQSCQQPSGYVDNFDDCDDNDVNILNFSLWYLDYDSDGFGDAAYPIETCIQPSGYVSDSNDCDDLNEERTPNTSWYLDLDGDGYGANVNVVQCEQPTGYVLNNLDCDDTEELAYTGAVEVCDEVDNNCDGSVDEQVLEAWYLDYDSDGYGDDTTFTQACEAPSQYYVNVGGDCDDEDELFSPGVPEGCGGLDKNCDGNIDNDADGDGYSDQSCGGSDCDDTDPTIVPEQNGGCAVGESCLDILDLGRSGGSGLYEIDPDGYGIGVDPFEAYCDMTTDGGGWTQIEYVLINDAEGYSQEYASVFSSVERGTIGVGSYKLAGSLLLDTASAFRYSEPSGVPQNSLFDEWTWDIRCVITADVLSKIQSPGFQNQVPAEVVCTDLNTGSVASNASYMNYQGWSGCWTGPRLWVGSSYSAPDYHGNYCVNCISTWKCGNSTNGVYSGPSIITYTSTAFWLR